MSKRMLGRALWVLAGAAILVVGAALVPNSPIYLPDLAAGAGYYDGHPARYWVKNLNNPDVAARKKAIQAVGSIGAAAGEAVPALADIMLRDPDRICRIEASLALKKMRGGARPVVPQLAEALADKEMLVRMNAAIALNQLGTDARSAVPALIRGLQDDENKTNLNAFTFEIQDMMAIALGKASAGSREGVPALMEALEKAQGFGMKQAAIRALGEVGPEAKEAAPLLRRFLKDRHPDVKGGAKEALEKIGEPLEAAAAPAPADAHLAAGAPTDLELPEAEREYIWKIEHHGNLLVKHGFAAVAAALKASDAAALTSLLADTFAGTDLARPQRTRVATDFAEVERLQDAGQPPVALDRAGFVARLLAARKLFPNAAPTVKFALITLSPKRRGDLDGPWEGTAQLRLHGEHAAGAPAEAVLTLRYEVPRPSKETFAKPGWLRAAGVLQSSTAKAPRYLFADVTRQRGLDPSRLHDNWTTRDFLATPGGVFVCDFDRDGVLDVLITDQQATLYRGRPDGAFEDVTARFGLPAELRGRAAAAWVDIDGDGWDDLILAGRAYRNEEGRRLVDYTDRARLALPPNPANIVVADFDRDGKLDLYVTRTGRPGSQSWLVGRTGESRGNALLRNLGDWQFADVTRAAGADGDYRSTFTAAWLDADNDGWPDLHVVNEFGDGLLLVNQRDSTFKPRPLADRPADFGTMGLAAGDVNNDGNIDIYCANMYSKAGTRVIGNLKPDQYPPKVMEQLRRFVAGSQLHLNRGGLKFDQVGPAMQVAAVGWAYGACLADLDNDGWLDVYATAGYVSRSRDDPDG